jgi:DHA1 family inner membrane transport protein
MSSDTEKKGTLLILSLTLSRLSPQTRGLITSLLLIEIGSTFGTSIGLTNQMISIASIASLVMALLMGLLSVRVKHRTLLVSGLILLTVSTIGCYVAPSFPFLLAVFALGGLATNMIIPMVSTLVDQHVPNDRRTNALSYLIAGNSILYLLGMPFVNYLGNWRQSFLFLTIPLLLVSLVMIIVFVPSEETVQRSSDVLAGYKGVFSTRSAVACLLGQAFGSGAWMITLSLAFSFFREVYSMSRTNVVYLTFGTSFAYIVGALSARQIIPRVGWRRSTMVSVVLMGFGSVVYLIGVNYMVSLVCVLMVSFLGGLNQSSSQGLNLGQLPELSGSMMSLVSAFESVGAVVSVSLGGLVLVWFGWGILGGLVGVFGLVGFLILSYYALEPKIE